MKTYLANIVQDLKPKNRLQTEIQKYAKNTLHRIVLIGDFDTLLSEVRVVIDSLNTQNKRCQPIVVSGYNERNGDAAIYFNNGNDSFLRVDFMEFNPNNKVFIEKKE